MLNKKIVLLGMLLIYSLSFGMEKLRLTTMNWEPFYGEKLEQNGFYSAITREAFKRAGYEIEIDFLPWARAIKMSKEGRYDGLMGAYYSDDRVNYFKYSEVVSTSDEIFLKLKKRTINFTSQDSLKNYMIGVTRGGTAESELRKNGFRLEPAIDEVQNIKKLNVGRIDVIVIDRNVYNDYITNIDPSLKGKFEMLEKPFRSSNVYNLISKKKPNADIIVQKFNESLNEMKADGSYERILKKFGQNN